MFDMFSDKHNSKGSSLSKQILQEASKFDEKQQKTSFLIMSYGIH